MEAYVLDWVNLLLRWAHVIVAIAWIGSSFYFVFLDNSLTKPADPDLKAKGVDGELWAVHGGGFYHPQKYMVAPKAIPENLHWFYWESYSTWLTGFALFTVLYLYQAGTFLIDRNVHAWSPAAAIAAALGFLVVFWIVYDGICRFFGQREGGDRIVGIGVTVAVVLASWLACQFFAGRAAFLLVGAMMATSMSANVFFWIIPGQRTVIAQMKAGQPVDPVHGQRAKQRSVHNTYFTLPVLIAMLSNHYGFLYGAPHNWLVLVLIMLAGALIRHSFVARHKALVQGQPVPWLYAGVGTAVIVGLIVWLAPAPVPKAAAAAPVSFAQVQAVVAQRCAMCHNEQVISKNIQLHTPELIAKNAQALYQQAVVLKAMPMNNATQITDAERGLLGRWFEAGAPLN
ncbi:urate hydroxylase PuuD [Piscinibacter sp.]|uniref:urate hydroxylase PuuD n=1 Tax=Piscinibacter sp. TaxID=1903157 RepID=UPI001B7847CE|nr:urate hydroxylase PuuD [Piscinibacter sp.]MBK7529508.1 urate hydroxylase PuuD [Piscinibacter sp.]MBP6544173.1 urate hydroxylase PuuD [Piscinibacter sp.]